MQLKHSPTKILGTGNSGSGKSTLATAYVVNAPQDRIFIFDHDGEFSERCQVTPCRSADELGEALDDDRKFIVFDPGRNYPGELPAAFEFFSEWVFRLAEELPGTKLFYADELQTYVEQHEEPWGLCALLETGRRRGMDTFLVTQQPNVIHNRFRNQLTEIVAFSQVDENATKFLVSQGFDEQEILDLPEFYFVSKVIRRKRWIRGHVEPATGRVFIDSTNQDVPKVFQPPADN